MKKLFGKIKSFICKIKGAIQKVTEKPADFLRKGRVGGLVMCILLPTLFLLQLVSNWSDTVIPLPLIKLLIPGVLFLAAEVFGLAVKLIFGCKNRSRCYFLLAWLAVAFCSLFATQLNGVPAGLLISFLLALSFDLLGRCVVGFFKTRRFKQVFGYVTLTAAAAVIVLFAVVLRLDTFGQSRIEAYLAVEEQSDFQEVAGFAQYLENGAYKVSVLDYGQEDSADIVTESVDISDLAEEDDGFSLSRDDGIGLENAPVAGRIWYPEGLTGCPVLFFVHGNHNDSVPSYQGYDYLGEYLASHGYVVVSVDENVVNGLGGENDARAVLLLENMKTILEENAKTDSPICGLIDPEKIAIGGHSRGGEMVATAYLFNELDVYPDNGNRKLDYNFNISSIIAIAPTVDQYMPAEHPVKISDVNYLLLHGSNDHDVSRIMGEKQYNNVSFTGDADCLKSYVYILGANHGQFNTTWGRYDLMSGMNGFLNTNHFLEDTQQQLIAKAYIRVFLDKTLLGQDAYETLLEDNREYRNHLPETVYITNYMDSDFERFCSFDEDTDIIHGATEEVVISCSGITEWKERMDAYGRGGDGENYVLDCTWEETANPSIEITFPAADLSSGSLSFRIADMREDIAEDISALDYVVELYDAKGNMVSIPNPRLIYPSLGVQLYKQDVFFNTYEYKHQMQTVQIGLEMIQDESFDATAVVKMVIILTEAEDGQIILDDVGFQKK